MSVNRQHKLIVKLDGGKAIWKHAGNFFFGCKTGFIPRNKLNPMLAMSLRQTEPLAAQWKEKLLHSSEDEIARFASLL